MPTASTNKYLRAGTTSGFAAVRLNLTEDLVKVFVRCSSHRKLVFAVLQIHGVRRTDDVVFYPKETVILAKSSQGKQLYTYEKRLAAD